jgi:hypothetical protein
MVALSTKAVCQCLDSLWPLADGRQALRSFLLMVRVATTRLCLASTAAWILNDISTTCPCTNNALASLSVVLICGSPLSFSFLPVAHNVICSSIGLFFVECFGRRLSLSFSSKAPRYSWF